MASNTPTILTRVAQQGIIEFQKQAYNMLGTQWNIREQMRQVDLAYMREKDQTVEHQNSKLANRYGDAKKFQNIAIPVVLPSVENAVDYQTSVFLTGSPVFGVVADAKYQDAAMQMEAVISENQQKGGWIRHLQMFFRDGFKYNLSAIEVCWNREVTATLEHDSVFAGGKQGKPKEVIWEGNTVRRLDPYNIMFDTRVPITEVSAKGEFAGWTELMSRVALKMYIATMPDKIVDNVVAAFESGVSSTGASSSNSASYYVPSVNQEALINANLKGGMDWMAWAAASQSASKIDYKNIYEVTTLYARIIPSDFAMKVPSPNTPQVWKFVFVNHSVIIYAERQTNAHGRLPILFGQPLEDGLSYQTKSLANNVTGIQDVASAMMNSVIAARRRSISDRGLFDPSRVGEAQINSDNPSAKIPVRPAAYGKPLSEAYYPIPFNDNTSGQIMQELGMVVKLGDMITGQNPARAGQFVKGNKTRTEYADVMNHSNARDQSISILLEDQVFTPLKEIIKLNILQYQGPTSVYYADKKQTIDVDPVTLRQAIIGFKMTDGIAPASKQINSDAFQTALQVIGSSPQIGAGYNIGPMFSYMMKTQGAHIAEFEKSEEQVAYEQAANQWSQMGQLALSKGQPWTQPQPTPEQFGYMKNGQLDQEKDEIDNPIKTLLTSVAQKAAASPAEQSSPPSQPPQE